MMFSRYGKQDGDVKKMHVRTKRTSTDGFENHRSLRLSLSRKEEE
jgi:hypothetical protein